MQRHSWERFDKAFYPLASQIEDLSRELLSISSRLSQMAVDYIFYHQFLNDELQREFRRLRRQRSGRESPYPHLSLAETVAFLQLGRESLKPEFARIEEEAKQVADRKMRELQEALKRAKRQGTPEAWQAAAELVRRPRKHQPSGQERRLNELAERIPAEPLSVAYAVYYGTPILPPGLLLWDIDDNSLPSGLVKRPRAPAGLIWELSDGGGLRFAIYSAKTRGLKSMYQRVVDYYQQVVSVGSTEPRTYTPRGAVTASYHEGPGLPHITVEVHRPADLPFPRPELVDDVFKAARRNFLTMLYDGRQKGRDARFAIRAWTVALLSDVAGMSRREAIDLWNRRLAPRALAYQHAPQGVTSSGEIQFQQDYRRLQERIERFTQSGGNTEKTREA